MIRATCLRSPQHRSPVSRVGQKNRGDVQRLDLACDAFQPQPNHSHTDRSGSKVAVRVAKTAGYGPKTVYETGMRDTGLFRGSCGTLSKSTWRPKMYHDRSTTAYLTDLLVETGFARKSAYVPIKRVRDGSGCIDQNQRGAGSQRHPSQFTEG
jgi:hypothetical protein